jgi:AAA15 family ATPase/GTPase
MLLQGECLYLDKIMQIEINGFRSFKNLVLSNLSKINIIVGQNNSGKTSLLESIELGCNPLNLGQLVTTSLSRDRANRSRYTRLEYISWLFPTEKRHGNETIREPIDIMVKTGNVYSRYKVSCKGTKVIENVSEITTIYNEDTDTIENLEDKKTVEVPGLELILSHQISSKNIFENAPIEQLNLTITRNSRFSLRNDPSKELMPTRMVTPTDHRYLPLSARFLSEVILAGDKPKILELLKLFDEDIEGFELINIEEYETVPYINHRLLGYAPVSVFGDGLRRALTLASALVRAENGVLFLDEIETAFHAKILEKIFSWLIGACHELNVQLFATTHSLEAIDAILSVDKEYLDELSAFRLEQKNGVHKAKHFSGSTLYDLRHELGQDVR